MLLDMSYYPTSYLHLFTSCSPYLHDIRVRPKALRLPCHADQWKCAWMYICLLVDREPTHLRLNLAPVCILEELSREMNLRVH